MKTEDIISNVKAGRRVIFPHLSGKKFAALSSQYPASSEKPQIMVAWKSRWGEQHTHADKTDIDNAVLDEPI